MKKPIIKRWWFWVIVLCLVSGWVAPRIQSAVHAKHQEEAAKIFAEQHADLPEAEAPSEPLEYTQEEQEAAAKSYYEKIGYDPTQENELGVIEDGIVVWTPKGSDTTDSGTSEEITTYIVNTSSGVFHRSGCSRAKKISEKNHSTFTGTRSEAAALYTPCGTCKP